MDRARVRRTPDEAKRLILEAGEELLATGGPAAVQVRAVAQRVGMTDAGVNHHFNDRDGLLQALLRHGGRQLRANIQALTATWLADGAHLAPLVESLAELYRRGYGQLATSLHAAGWRDHGSGMLQPVVDAIHAARVDQAHQHDQDAPPKHDTRLAVAALHHALATEPVYGPAFRRSVGLTGAAASDPEDQITWWTTVLANALGITP